MKIDAQHDCTERQLINDVVRIIATGLGHQICRELDVTKTENPQVAAWTEIAIEIYAAIAGDEPTYGDDRPEINSRCFCVINFDAFERSRTIECVPDRCYVEGVDEPETASGRWSFDCLLKGAGVFSCQFADPADRVYVYSITWRAGVGIARYYVTTNFDVDLALAELDFTAEEDLSA